MALLRIRDRPFAVGCAWQPLDSPQPPKREVARIAGGAPAVVLPSRDGSMPMLGYSREAPPGTPTLAGSLATASGSGIYLLPVPEAPGAVWACAVVNGSVLNGFDMVGSRDAVFEEVRDLLRMYGDDAEQIPIRADYGAFPEEGELGRAAEVLQDISAFLDPERLATLQLDRSRQKMLAALAIVGALTAAVSAGTWIWTQKPRLERMVGPTPEEIEAQNRVAWRAGLARALSGLERPAIWPLAAAGEMWRMAALDGLGRWRYKGADCTSSGCNSLWEGGEQALIGLVADRFGAGPGAVSVEGQGRGLTLRHPAGSWTGGLRTVTDADLEQLPTLAELQTRWHDEVALAMARTSRLKGEPLPAPRTVTPAGVDLQKGRPLAPMPEPVVGTAVVSGSETASLPTAIGIAERLDMAPKRLMVAPMRGGMERNLWKLELEYVARN